MNKQQKLCVAFDLDDTLYKERDFVKSGYAAVVKTVAVELGCEVKSLNDIVSSAENVFDALLYIQEVKDRGITITDILSIYRAHCPELTLPKESREVIDFLRDIGVEIAIITDGRNFTQWNKIKALGLDRMVDPRLIVVSADIGADKTTAKPFETVMERYPAHKYIYVGDNPAKDFHFAKELGWLTIMLKDTEGINVHSQRLDDIDEVYRPEIIIDNIKNLKDIILPCL